MAEQDQRHIDRKAEEDKQAFIIASVAARDALPIEQEPQPEKAEKGKK